MGRMTFEITRNRRLNYNIFFDFLFKCRSYIFIKEVGIGASTLKDLPISQEYQIIGNRTQFVHFKYYKKIQYF